MIGTGDSWIAESIVAEEWISSASIRWPKYSTLSLKKLHFDAFRWKAAWARRSSTRSSVSKCSSSVGSVTKISSSYSTVFGIPFKRESMTIWKIPGADDTVRRSLVREEVSGSVDRNEFATVWVQLNLLSGRGFCTCYFSPVGHIRLPFMEWDTWPRLPPDSQWVCSHHRDVRFCLLSSPEQQVRPSPSTGRALWCPRIGIYPSPCSPHLSWHMAVARTYSILAQRCHWRIFWPDASIQTQRCTCSTLSVTEDSASSSPCVRGSISEPPAVQADLAQPVPAQ